MSDKVNYSILYVEDDRVIRKIYEKYFVEKTDKLFIAENGKIGLEIYKKEKPDIIITDIIMPEMDGLEMSKLIKDEDKEAEIVVISSSEGTSELIRAINIGITQFLLKPTKVDKLDEIIDKIVKKLRDKKELKEYKKILEKKVEERTKKLKEANEIILKGINKRKQIENKIIMLSNVVEQNPISILVGDTNGKIKYANKKFYELIDKKDGDLIGENWFELDNSNAYREMWNYLLQDKAWSGEVCLNKGENKKWRMVYASTIKDNNNKTTHYMAIIDDITKRKLTEEELIYEKKKSEEANKAKSMFLANMSHEIRTPMNGVFMMSDILLGTKLTPRQREVNMLLKESARSLLNIINDILDFSKIEAGKIELVDEHFNMESVIKAIVKVFDIIAKSKKIKLTYEIDSKVYLDLIGDYKRLKQILNNLISNAIKFTNEGEVFIKLNLLEEDDEKIKIRTTIKDTGMGIDSKDLDIIFNDFVQSDSSYTKQFKGTGLGLAISKKIVELMNGSIWVDSVMGKGSEFSFTAEFRKSKQIVKNFEDEELEYKKLLTEENIKNGSNLKILLVEDNKINQKAIKKSFLNYNWDIDVANNGEEALELWRKNEYDIIFMDIQMPVMNGIDCTKYIREHEKTRMPIIAVTAYATENELGKILNSGVDDFVIKPVESTELILKMERLLKVNVINK